MIPSRRLIWIVVLLAVPLLMAGLPSVTPGIGGLPAVAGRSVADLALVLDLLLIVVCVVDLRVSARPEEIEIHREISEVLSAGTPNPARLVVRNRSDVPVTLTVHDDPGSLCVTQRMPQSRVVSPFREEVFTYTVTPLKRGASELPAVHIRYPTRLGLWQRHDVRDVVTPVRIYPDIRAVHRYELMASRNRLSEIGVRNMRMPGQGREFERLREFRYGDEIRQIDWKATSRHRELISREFNVERNQNLVIMVDCGRFMRTETEGLSYLDRALNSAIMLSYIALGQGDNVSLMAFSNRIERFVRPVRGKPGIQSLLRSTYDIEASTAAADYTMALEYLAKVQRKRALVVLITYVTDELQLDVIGESLQLRSLPWLPMCVLLQDVGLRHLAESVPIQDLDAFHTAAAAQMLSSLTNRAAQLRDNGVLLVDTAPELLTEKLINEYLVVKMRNLL